MKILSLAAVLGLFLSSSALASICSCTAPDNSCSTEAICLDGCGAFCGEGGFCRNFCSRESSASGIAVDAGASEASSLLSESLGQSVSFAPLTPDWRFSFDLKGASVDEVASSLEERGALAVGPTQEGVMTRIHLSLPAKEIPAVVSILIARLHAPVHVEAVRTDSATFVIRGARAQEVIDVLRTKPGISRLLLADGEQ